jgi:queuosine precursor transporter
MGAVKKQFGGDWNEKYLYFYGTALTTFLITSNIMALKFFELNGIKFGGGMLFFPFCLITGDIVTEVYGFRKTRQIIISSLLAYMFFMIASQITIALPPADEWTLQDSFEKIFKQAPRVFVAGCLAYLVGELSNSYVMAKMKASSNGKSFWIRALVSTIVGQTLNSFTFQFIAFLGIMSASFLLKVVLNGTLMKVIIEIIVLPFTSFLCYKMKNIEGIDFYDYKPSTVSD